MLVKEEKKVQRDGTYYEAVYDSTNILQTTYFPHAHLLYISFNRGGVYSYGNVSPELYEEFKAAESQGIFFAKTIKSQPTKYPYRKEFTLYPEEVKSLKEEVDEHKDNEAIYTDSPPLPSPVLTLESGDDLETNNIVFSIDGNEAIRLNKDGFHWRGKLVEEDKVIYLRFKEWLDFAHSEMNK